MKSIRIVLLIILIQLSLNARCQIGIQTSIIKPSGMLGYVFKPNVCVELTFGGRGDEYKAINTSFTIGFYKLNSRHDSFTIYAYGYDNGYKLLPGYETFDKYFAIPLGFCFDYRFLDKKISPIIALDVNAYFISYHHVKKIEQLENLEEIVGIGGIGIQPRIGVIYTLDNEMKLSLNFARSMTLQTDYGTWSYWKLSVGVSYPL